MTVPWLFCSDDPVKTARYLIQQAGGAKEARAAIATAAKADKRPRGRPEASSDLILLHLAAAERDCSVAEALRRIANLVSGTAPAKAATVRRLARKLKGRALANFDLGQKSQESH